MSVENGLPQYVSKHPKTKIYRYFRRPSKGVTGSAFVRSFGSKDCKAVHSKYAAIHAEAETYFDRLATGRALTDQVLLGMSMTRENLDELFRSYSGKLNQPEDWHRFIAKHSTDQMKALADPDRDRLIIMLRALYAGTEAIHLGIAEHRVEIRREYIRETFGDDSVPAPANAFTLMDAYKQAWLPAKHRPSNTQVEITRYVNELIALNGTLDLKEYTRNYWAAWRADCLSKHGPGWTTFKRYTMMKTIVTEAIRAGLFERKHFTGQDIVLRKPAWTKLCNEGWADDELKELWASDIFRVREKKHPDASERSHAQ